MKELTSGNLLLHNTMVHNEVCYPPWACSFDNMQPRLRDLYDRWGNEKIESDEELVARLLSNVLDGGFPVNQQRDMQDLIMWKIMIKTKSVMKKNLSGALNAFMAKHGMDINKVAKINVASFKVKSLFLYGDEFHQQCWQPRTASKPKRKSQASSGPWVPMAYAPEEIKSMPDLEHEPFFL